MEVTMASASLPDWENLSDDSRYVYEALTQLGFTEFSTLPIPDMQLVLALALYLKRTQGRHEFWES
jgi:hypothetical protein